MVRNLKATDPPSNLDESFGPVLFAAAVVAVNRGRREMRLKTLANLAKSRFPLPAGPVRSCQILPSKPRSSQVLSHPARSLWNPVMPG